MNYYQCSSCNKELYVSREDSQPFCSVCDRDKISFYVMPEEEAKKILSVIVQALNECLEEEIKTYAKMLLLQDLVLFMDLYLHKNLPNISYRDWFYYLTLIKRVNSIPAWDQSNITGFFNYSDEILDRLILFQKVYILYKEALFLVSNDWGTIQISSEEDFESLSTAIETYKDGHINATTFVRETFKADFKRVSKLLWTDSILPSFIERGLLSASEARKFIEENKEEYERATKEIAKRPSTLLSIPDFMSDSIDFMDTLYSILKQSSFWVEELGLDIQIDDNALEPLLRLYYDLPKQWVITVSEFEGILSKNGIGNSLKSKLLLSDANPNAIPCFATLGSTHIVLTKHNYFLWLMYFCTISRIGQSKLTQFYEEDGKRFEGIVKKIFEDQLKMKVDSNQNLPLCNPCVEIDHIVWNDQIVLVIEAKRRSFRPLTMDRRRQSGELNELLRVIIRRERPLNDYYSAQRHLPATLSEKVKLVKAEREKLSFQKNLPIIGLLVSRLHPPIHEFAGCYLYSYKQIKDQNIITQIITAQRKK